jgi:hypothetical protein
MHSADTREHTIARIDRGVKGTKGGDGVARIRQPPHITRSPRAELFSQRTFRASGSMAAGSLLQSAPMRSRKFTGPAPMTSGSASAITRAARRTLRSSDRHIRFSRRRHGALAFGQVPAQQVRRPFRAVSEAPSAKVGSPSVGLLNPADQPRRAAEC